MRPTHFGNPSTQDSPRSVVAAPRRPPGLPEFPIRMHKHTSSRAGIVLAAFQLLALATTAAGQTTHPASAPILGHPRLYFTASDLPALRAMRFKGLHKNIWDNIQSSAD